VNRSEIAQGPYRYRLDRAWGGLFVPRRLVFVMLNPSSANGLEDDPTLRRCLGFARALEFDSLSVVNLFALRSRLPSALLEHPDPVGPSNEHHVLQAIDGADVIAAWGSFRYPIAFRERVGALVTTILFRARTLSCLGTTLTGAPRHPLYVHSDTRPRAWPPDRATP